MIEEPVNETVSLTKSKDIVKSIEPIEPTKEEELAMKPEELEIAKPEEPQQVKPKKRERKQTKKMEELKQAEGTDPLQVVLIVLQNCMFDCFFSPFNTSV
jgi:hypothetical protein